MLPATEIRVRCSRLPPNSKIQWIAFARKRRYVRHMKRTTAEWARALRARVVVVWMVLALAVAMGRLRADQVELQNGDHYVGRVVSLSGETLVLQSDVLGTLRLPRGKVASITLGAVPVVAPA